jgi:hypothetical protein
MFGQEAARERNLAFFSIQQKSLFAEFFRAARVVAPDADFFLVAPDARQSRPRRAAPRGR